LSIAPTIAYPSKSSVNNFFIWRIVALLAMQRAVQLRDFHVWHDAHVLDELASLRNTFWAPALRDLVI
jgi:hypothetical protein